jgi:catalase
MDTSVSKSNPITFEALAVIVTTICIASFAFAFTAAWLTPHRLTPEKIVAALQPPGGPALGHRRNHAKGICFTGTFDANGTGSELSRSTLFEPGSYPVIGRFNIGSSDPGTPDPMAQVRGLGIRIMSPTGQEWRSAMIDAPVFVAPTPQAFFELLTAGASKDPDAVKHYSEHHPEMRAFVSWAKGHNRTESWTEDRFNSLDSFVFINGEGLRSTVRWSLVPVSKAVSIPPDKLPRKDPDFLQNDILQRVRTKPQDWLLTVVVAQASDPVSDPTKAWPTNRRTIEVGTLHVQEVQPEADGPCRDINFDPTVLPTGIETSDDPFPAARSAAYRVSFNERLAESSKYPHTQQRGKP